MPHKNLISEKTLTTTPKTGSPSERAIYCCLIAKRFEDAGEYEAAYESLVEFWPEREQRLDLEGLEPPAKAEVLLRAGILAGWLGAADQRAGAQENAKNLISESIEIFAALGDEEKVAQGHAAIASCYWREGAFDEARVHLADAIDNPATSAETRAVALLRRALVERSARRLNDALQFYTQARPLIEATGNHALKGKLHNGLGTLLHCIALGEHSEDEFDRALVEFAGASFHFEQAGHERHCARVENNLGYLLFTVNRFQEAHDHLNRARKFFQDLGDIGAVAQVDDTRAKAMLAEDRAVEAERVSNLSVNTLERGGEQSLLAEALTTHGVALARLGRKSEAASSLERAVEIARTSGDLEGAGRAQLSLIEELGDRINPRELTSTYRSATDLLARSQDHATAKRLVGCATKVIDALEPLTNSDQVKAHNWEDFSFRQEIVDCERKLIERALRDAGGTVTHAARLLGFKHHQSLISLINSRHKDLLEARSAVRTRRRSIIDKTKHIPQLVQRSRKQAQPISILQVEDNKLVAGLIGEMLAAQNWDVTLCTDGQQGLTHLEGKEPYDLLLFDNELPGVNGLTLAQRARELAHRRETPILMVSAGNCEAEASSAGVDAFLSKPEDIERVPATIARLLRISLKKTAHSAS
jgi:CheY-like chemotaxis protein